MLVTLINQKPQEKIDDENQNDRQKTAVLCIPVCIVYADGKFIPSSRVLHVLSINDDHSDFQYVLRKVSI